MTVTSQLREIDYVGDNVTTVWAYNFRIYNAEAVNVTLRDTFTDALTVLTPSDYDITGLNDSAGGTITYPTVASGLPPINTTTILHIYRTTEQEQEISVNNQTGYDAVVVEGVWDRIVMMIQDLQAGTISLAAFLALLEIIIELSGLVTEIGNWLGELDDFPVNPDTGDYFYHTLLEEFYIWDGDSWEILDGDSIIQNLITEVTGGLGSLAVRDDGLLINASVGIMNFGAGLAATDDGAGQVTITTGATPGTTPGPGIVTNLLAEGIVVNDDTPAVAQANSALLNSLALGCATWIMPQQGGIIYLDGKITTSYQTTIFGFGACATEFGFLTNDDDCWLNNGDDGAGDFKGPLTFLNVGYKYYGAALTGSYVGMRNMAPMSVMGCLFADFLDDCFVHDNVTISEAAAQCTFWDSEWLDNGGDGIVYNNTGSGTTRKHEYYGCRASQNTGSGVVITDADDITWHAGQIGNNGDYGLDVVKANRFKWEAGSATNNTTKDLRIGANVQNSWFDAQHLTVDIATNADVTAFPVANKNVLYNQNTDASVADVEVFGAGGGSGGGDVTINAYTASHTLVIGDASDYVTMDVASANNLTVPPNSSVAFNIGNQITIRQIGLGQTTIVEGAGVTIYTPETLVMRKQFSTVTLVKVGTDEWDLMGDVELFA